MSDENCWDGKNRRHNPEMCEMRFRTIENRMAENYAVLDTKANKNHDIIESKLEDMSKKSDHTAGLVYEIREKVFDGFSDTLVRIDKRTQWMIGMFMASALGLIASMFVEIAGK